MQSNKMIWVMVLILALLAGLSIFWKITKKTPVEVWTEPPFTEAPPTTEETPTATVAEDYRNEELGIKFAYPAGFVQVECEGETELVCLNEATKSGRISTRPEIVVRKIEMENPNDFETLIMQEVVFDPSGLKPEAFSEFKPVTAGKNTFYKIRVGLFEGILTNSYYLVRSNYILAFDVTSSPVDWTAAKYDPEQDELNQKFLEMAEGMEFTE